MNKEIEFLKHIYLGNTLSEWFIAIVVAVLLFISLIIIKVMVVKRLGAFAAKTSTDIDDLVVEIIKKTKLIFLIILSLYGSTLTLSLPAFSSQVIHKTVFVFTLLQSAIWGLSVIEYLINKNIKRRKEENPSSATTIIALGYFIKIILWSIVVLLALDFFGFNITTLVAGLGIGGIAIALAVQNVLGDVLASLSIVFDKPFVLGDFIIVENYFGTVEYIGLKTTRIRSLSGEQIIFSNADLLRCRIRNYKRMNERRIVFNFGVKYDTPYDKLSNIVNIAKDILKAKNNIRIERVHFKEFGDSALIFEIAYHVLDPDYNLYMDLQQEINLDLYRKFDEEGIEFAFPTQSIHLVKK